MWYLDRERGLHLLYQRIHGDWSSFFHCFPHAAKLLLDVLKMLLPRPFPYLRLIKGGSIASIVLIGNPFIAVFSWGLIMIGLLGSAGFSFSVSVPMSVVVSSFFRLPLHLASEFLLSADAGWRDGVPLPRHYWLV